MRTTSRQEHHPVNDHRDIEYNHHDRAADDSRTHRGTARDHNDNRIADRNQAPRAEIDAAFAEVAACRDQAEHLVEARNEVSRATIEYMSALSDGAITESQAPYDDMVRLGVDFIADVGEFLFDCDGLIVGRITEPLRIESENVAHHLAEITETCRDHLADAFARQGFEFEC